jgi:hypothetical protein
VAAALVQSGSTAQTGTAAPAHTLGAAPTQGNLLVAAVASQNLRTMTATAGWTYINDPSAQARLGLFYKVAGASESATQAPCTFSGIADTVTAIHEYSGNIASPFDIAGLTADATSPQDQAAINPTDNVDTLMVGAAMNTNNTTYSGQTIGGSAATERTDKVSNSSTSLSTFDRLNVNTSTSTFAAQATPSGTPTNGNIGLAIFRLVSVQTVNPTGIASTASTGAPTANPGRVTVTPGGIGSSQALGTPTATPGVVTLMPAGIASVAAVGTPITSQGTLIQPAGIASVAAVGAPSITVGAVTLHPVGIPSSARVGAASVLDASLVPGVGTLVASDAAVGSLVASFAPLGALVAAESVLGRLVPAVAPVAA